MKIVTKHHIFITTIGVIIIILGTAFIKDQAPPTSGDYINDTTQFHIVNDMQKSLQPINMLLCVLTKTNFTTHTNKGTYLSLVSMSSCGEQANLNKKTLMTAASLARSTQTKYMKLIINAKRNLNGPEILNIWLSIPHQEGAEYSEPIMFKIKAKVSKAPTTANPYGQLVLNYAGYAINIDKQLSPTPIIRGYLNNSKNMDNNPQMAYVEQEIENGNSITREVLLTKLAVGGYGRSETNINGSKEVQAIAYNADLLMLDTNKDKAQTQFCYNRNDFTNTVYQYGLYNTKGLRVNPKDKFLIYMNNKAQHFLSYSDNGNLDEINSNCVNSANNISKLKASCYLPKTNYNIPDGTRLVSPSNKHNYWVKALSVGQILNTLPTRICESALPDMLSNAHNAKLPKISSWTEPKLGNPPIINKPEVINGVDQN